MNAIRKSNKLIVCMAFVFALAIMMIGLGFLPAYAQSGNPNTYIPSEDQEELDPLLIPKYAHELTIPAVWQPRVIRGKGGEVIRHQYELQSVERTQVQMLPPPFFPMTTVHGYCGAVKTPGPMTDAVGCFSPGPVFEAVRGIPSRLTKVNQIMKPNFLATDPVLFWANPLAMEDPTAPFTPFPPGYADAQFPVPHVTHIHGLVVKPQFDGTADEWFTPFGQIGPSYVSNVYDLPNEQPPTQLFYHDHSLGVTRLGVYSGVVGHAYFIRDPNSPLDGSNSPLPKGEFEIPLAIADRSFFDDGELNFPRESDATRGILFTPYWQAESEADTIVVNGKVWPNLNVKRQQYRFRVLAASNERVWTFQFENGLFSGNFVSFTIVGSDGGYLPAPQVVDRVTQGITERADILVDFSQFEAGTQIFMRNTHEVTDPTGEACDPATVLEGVVVKTVSPCVIIPDPETAGQVMRFTVVDSPAVHPPVLNASLFPARAELVPNAPTRTKVMVRFRDDVETNRLRTQDGVGFSTPPTEFPLVGSTEEWDIVHTGDVDTDADAGTHLIHLHLIEFQVLSRQKFDNVRYLQDWHRLNGHRPITRPIVLDPTPYLTGPVLPPAPVETGWKDTFRADPGFVNRIVARWAPQETPTGGVAPGENQFPMETDFPSETDTFTGPGYVWHCHIVGHEDHEMLRQQPVIKLWTPGVSYPVGRVVAFGNINYRVRVAHTSMASQPPTARFDLWERVNNNDGTWQPQIIYAVGDRVLHAELLYAALQVHQAQPGQTPATRPELWDALPMTACGQIAEFCAPGNPVFPGTEALAAQFFAIGQAGNENACRSRLARALGVCQFVEPMSCAGLCQDPIVITVPDGTTFSSTGMNACYETDSQLYSITLKGDAPFGAKVTVNGREMDSGVNYPLPPQRHHGYCIQTFGGANFTAK